MPYNIFDDFCEICKDNPSDVIVEKKAEKSARDYYNLKTKQILLQFIGNNGLEHVKHLNKTEWRRNPDRKNNPLDVNSYICKTNFYPCYIAIIFIPSLFGKPVNKWKLKSFHPPNDTQATLEDKLKALGF